MATYDDEQAALAPRPEGVRGESASPASEAEPLLLRIAALEGELALLRGVASEKAELERVAAQLREANENLVLATVHAQSSRDDAEQVNRRQNEFLAMLAHELRNPLAPISMAATLLERVADTSSRQLHLAQVIGRQVEHMAHLLDDLLDAARISSGKITLSIETVLLSEVIEQAVETVQPRMREREQRLEITLPDTPLLADGDPVRLAQVLTNLLGNASKYTPDGGRIAFRAGLDDGWLVLTVEDNGCGIAPEVLPNIFDLFTQGPRSLARSEGGLGVGLNVVRNLVVMHGGEVEGESAGSGLGSRFTVRLPPATRACAEPARPAKAPAAAGGPRRVLLVEDNLDACNMLRALLIDEGHDVDAAYDGKSGLAAARRTPYDVVVCDIGLPGLDGLGLVRALRASSLGARPFAIAVSGYGQADDRQRGLEAGFDHYLVKPVEPRALLALLATTPAAPD